MSLFARAREYRSGSRLRVEDAVGHIYTCNKYDLVSDEAIASRKNSDHSLVAWVVGSFNKIPYYIHRGAEKGVSPRRPPRLGAVMGWSVEKRLRLSLD
jgi:hypothetical protein